MSERVIRIAHIGYGMFGSDVVAGTLHDLQRNGISPYLGRVGLDDYAPEYHDVKFEVVAIGEKLPEAAQRAVTESQELTGQMPKAYVGDTTWVDIVAEHPDLDLIVVATPDPLHTPPVLEALRNGVHAITEKPMCLHMDEADEMIALAENNGLILGVDMHKRYDPDHLRVFKELSKDLGHPIYCRGVLEEPLEVSTSIFKWAEESDPFTYVG
ncbi:MAG: Gfo/Idh/MocA family oxidoreductase, partial [Armatimonadota bacterium]